MIKYLINSYWDLNKPIHWFKALSPNRIMPNPGDMVYAKGVMDALDVGDVEFINTGYWHFKGYSDEKIDEINNTCAAFIMPLADVFRSTGWRFLEDYLRLIKKLRIPVVVPSVGLRADDGSEDDPKVKEIAYRFCSTILDHSALIGLRGYGTARYLEKLGFVQGRHFKVIGCPSMYAHDGAIFSEPKTEFESCVYGINKRAGEKINSYIVRNAICCDRRYLISQDYREFELYFLANKSFRKRWIGGHSGVYWDILESAAKNDELRYFFDLSAWKGLVAKVDYSISCRIHGTILATLMGKPSAIVPFEMRTLELAEYHNLPIVTAEDVASDTAVKDVFNRFDFDKFNAFHSENLSRYVKFLRLNGLPSIFGAKSKPANRKIGGGIVAKEMKPFECAHWSERLNRQFLWNILRIKRRLCH